MIDRNRPGNQTQGEKQGGRGEPDAVYDIPIVDYVMLDFGDEHFAPWENDQRGQWQSHDATTREDHGEDHFFFRRHQ